MFTGGSVAFKADQRMAFYAAENRPKDPPDAPLVVDLEVGHAVWRNICSAIIDRDTFAQLTSTPLWLKAVFGILTIIPYLKNALLGFMLWIQLRVIFSTHGIYISHGSIPFTLPWMLQPFGGKPPSWAIQWQLYSLYFIARVVMDPAYWIGITFLGMQGEYAEYTPSGEYVIENSRAKA